jgi:hypothetical protein
MGAIGGDIIEAAFNHPTLGSGVLFPKANEDSTLDLGGFRSDDGEDGIDGSGEMIDKMTRKRWGAEMVVAWDNNSRQELEKAVAMANSPVQATWTISHVSGAVYKGKGKPVGDLKGSALNATFPLKLAGGSILKKIL